MYGNAILIMLSSFLITAALSVRLCTPQTLSRVSIPVSERLRKGSIPQRKRSAEIALPENNRALQKWNGSRVQNWAMVRNQLITDDKIKARIEKYEHLI